MLRWIYEIIYGAIADCFEMIGNMSAEVFDLEWVQATVKLFTLFGWGLFVAGTVVAVFDVAIEYQCGRANIKTTALNILKGFFACSLIGVVPIELYKFCISLQNTFSHDLIGIASSGINSSLADVGLNALVRLFSPSIGTTFSLLNLLCMIAFAYCVIKMFFCQYQEGRNPAHSDGGRLTVYVFRAERICRRLQSVDETNCRTVLDCIFADYAVVLGADHFPRQYAVGAWHYACGK